MTHDELVARIAALVDEYLRDTAARMTAAFAGTPIKRPVPRQANSKSARIIELYNAGHRIDDIANAVDSTELSVNALLCRARKAGLVGRRNRERRTAEAAS